MARHQTCVLGGEQKKVLIHETTELKAAREPKKPRLKFTTADSFDGTMTIAMPPAE
jgi:hypothetical protein